MAEGKAEEGTSTRSGKPGRFHQVGRAIKGWATTYDAERQRKQAAALQQGYQKTKEVLTKERDLPTISPTVATGTLKSLAFVLIALGLVDYLLRLTTTGLSVTAFYLSLILFLISGYALAQKVGKDRLFILIPMLGFVIWYWVFEGSIDPEFLVIFFIVFGGAIVVPLILSKGEGTGPLLWGFVPVLFLFLDIGLLPWLVEEFTLSVTPLLSNLILFMPWWALLGLFLLPELESSGLNFMINVFRMGGILYIILVLVVPAIPDVGFTPAGALPSVGELEQAQARLREQLPQRENPFISNLACLAKSAGVGVQECVAQRQLDSELQHICEKQEGHKKGTPSYEQCLAQERERRKNVALLVGGAVDPTIKIPMKAELKIDKNSFPQEYHVGLAYAADFMMDNPRGQKVVAEFGCNFTGKGRTMSVEGVIKAGLEMVEFSDQKFKSTILCLPTAPLNGSYTLFMSVTLRNLETKSRLQRAFIGIKTPEEKEALRKEVDKVISVKESLAPAEFAFINFYLGHAKDEALIENSPYKTIILRANVENNGKGKITALNQYAFSLDGFVVDDERCRQGTITRVDSTRKTIALPTCIITDYPEQFKDPIYWEPVTFIATLRYDYEITVKEDFKIPVFS